MSFGNVFKNLRKSKNLTQDQVANLLLVTPQAISRWENGTAMPDISMLIPIANLFSVSTDTLLEVNVEQNNAHIDEMILHVPIYADKYGNSSAQKLAIYEEEVRKHPESTALKEALTIVLLEQKETEDHDTMLRLYRRFVSLTEDIIEAGGGQFGISYHRSMLALYLKKLNNPEHIKEMAADATEISASKEVLLPYGLSGREQIEARKDLIFKCADIIISSLYAMLDEDCEELTDEEYQCIANGERIIAALYGQSFADHYVLIDNLYKGVRYDLKKGNIEQAKVRVIDIARRLETRNTEPDLDSPLVTEHQAYLHHIAAWTRVTVEYDAVHVLERILNDFPAIKDIRHDDPQFESAIQKMKGLMDSDGGQEAKDANAFIKKMWLKDHPQAT